MPRTHCDVPLFAWHTSEAWEFDAMLTDLGIEMNIETWPSKVAEIAGWELDLGVKRSRSIELCCGLLLNSNETAVALVHRHNW